MNESLSLILDKLTQSNSVEKSIQTMSGSDVTWLPLIQIGTNSLRMGLTLRGTWAIEGKTGLLLLDQPRSFVAALPLLEHPKELLSQQIHQSLHPLDLRIAAEEILPLVDVVRAGLEQGSTYWADLALNWFVELPLFEKHQLLDSLAGASTAKWASQKLRHRVNRELAKLKNDSRDRSSEDDFYKN
jgi:hypothetical protein